MRIFTPLRSLTVFTSLRHQPPICTPVLPAGKEMMPKSLKNSRTSSRPPP